MAGPRTDLVRSPAVAGLFYPAGPGECRAQAAQLLQANELELSARLTSLPARLLGALVPHAGWMCSGAIAGEAITALARRAGAVDLVVVFGAIHTPIDIDCAALDTNAKWAGPTGEAVVASEIRAKLNENRALFVEDERFHRREHAVEVELPLIELTWPGALILPVEVPPIDDAIAIGRETATRIIETKQRAVFLASSDLTHYGPAYDFAPAGVGLSGLKWAKDNDRRLLELIERYEVARIVPEVRQSLNACGAGAIAAMLSACREIGAANATVLRHANSYEVLSAIEPLTPDNAVGYAAVVVG
jgi:AmmeMemoRadiSam system protein B